MEKSNENGRKTMLIANWKVYLGVAIIIIQLFAYGFLFVQDRNDVIKRVEKNERDIVDLRDQMKVLKKIETLEINIRLFMKQQGYEYVIPENN
jgi:hypothetical protein